MDYFRSMGQGSNFKKFINSVPALLVLFILFFISFKYQINQNQEIHRISNLLKSSDFINVYRFYFFNDNGKLILLKPKYFQTLDFDFINIQNNKLFDETGNYRVEIYSVKNKLIWAYTKNFKIQKTVFIDIPEFLNIGSFLIKDKEGKIIFKYDKLKDFAFCNENKKCEKYESWGCVNDCDFIRNDFYPLRNVIPRFSIDIKNLEEKNKNNRNKCPIVRRCYCKDEQKLVKALNNQFKFKINLIKEKFKIDPIKLVKIIAMAESNCTTEHFRIDPDNIDIGLFQLNSKWIPFTRPIFYECIHLLKKDYKFSDLPDFINDAASWRQSFLYNDLEMNICYGLIYLLLQGCDYNGNDYEKIMFAYLGYNQGYKICNYVKEKGININDFCEYYWKFQGTNIKSCIFSYE